MARSKALAVLAAASALAAPCTSRAEEPDRADTRLRVHADVAALYSTAEENAHFFQYDGLELEQAAVGFGLAAAVALGQHLELGLQGWGVDAPNDRRVLALGVMVLVRPGSRPATRGLFVAVTPSVSALWLYPHGTVRGENGFGLRGAAGWTWRVARRLELGFQLTASHSHNVVPRGSPWDSRAVGGGLVIGFP